MSTQAARRAQVLPGVFSKDEVVRLGRQVIDAEASALSGIAEKLNSSFFQAVELLHSLRGNLIVTGMGKAGLIGQKLVATFASTGTRAHFLHPAEAIHGDLGRVHQGDVVVVLSQSGETGESLGLLPAGDEGGWFQEFEFTSGVALGTNCWLRTGQEDFSDETALAS